MTQRHAPRRVLTAFAALTAVGALLGAGTITGQAAAGAPAPATAVDVPWTGNGTNLDGACADIFLPGTDEKLTPGDGQQGWLFILTSPFDLSSGSTLTFSFSDGTSGTVAGIPRPGGNGAFQFIVYTTAGATLDDATATNGTSRSVLTVSHCQGTGTGEEEPVVLVEKTVGITFDQTYAWDIDKSFVSGSPSGTPGVAQVDYEVVATRTGPTPVADSYQVSGTITVTNAGAIPVDVTDVVDQPSWIGTDCTVDTSTLPVTLDENTPSVVLPYECATGEVPVETDLTNTGRASISWGDGATATVPSDPVPVDFTAATLDDTFHAAATLSDDRWSLGDIAIAPEDLAADGTYTKDYSVMVNILPPPACEFTNTATVTSDGVVQDTDQVTVRVCSTVGGLTIGYWANKGLPQSWAAWPGIKANYLNVYGDPKAWSPTSAKALADKILKASCTGDCLEMFRAQLFATIMNAATISGYADQCVALPAALALQTGEADMTVAEALLYVKTNYSSSWTTAQRTAWKTFFDNLNQHSGGELQCITEV